MSARASSASRSCGPTQPRKSTRSATPRRCASRLGALDRAGAADRQLELAIPGARQRKRLQQIEDALALADQAEKEDIARRPRADGRRVRNVDIVRDHRGLGARRDLGDEAPPALRQHEHTRGRFQLADDHALHQRRLRGVEVLHLRAMQMKNDRDAETTRDRGEDRLAPEAAAHRGVNMHELDLRRRQQRQIGEQRLDDEPLARPEPAFAIGRDQPDVLTRDEAVGDDRPRRRCACLPAPRSRS